MYYPCQCIQYPYIYYGIQADRQIGKERKTKSITLKVHFHVIHFPEHFMIYSHFYKKKWSVKKLNIKQKYGRKKRIKKGTYQVCFHIHCILPHNNQYRHIDIIDIILAYIAQVSELLICVAIHHLYLIEKKNLHVHKYMSMQ